MVGVSHRRYLSLPANGIEFVGIKGIRKTKMLVKRSQGHSSSQGTLPRRRRGQVDCIIAAQAMLPGKAADLNDKHFCARLCAWSAAGWSGCWPRSTRKLTADSIL